MVASLVVVVVVASLIRVEVEAWVAAEGAMLKAEGLMLCSILWRRSLVLQFR